MSTELTDRIGIAGAPDIAGLSFRLWRGAEDYPGMFEALHASEAADGEERADSFEDFAHSYAHLYNCEPGTDILIAEIEGQIVGYGRTFWRHVEAEARRVYTNFGFLRPEWRRKGIGGAMLRWLDARCTQIAATQPDDAEKLLENFAGKHQAGKAAMLEAAGYQVITYGALMSRPIDPIPEIPLPEGIELRAARPEHYRAVWEAHQEAFRDHFGYSAPNEGDYEAWLEDPSYFQPELWVVAWEGDQVAGKIENFIDRSENEKYSRRRGWTERICVRRPWRRSGLAKAMIAASLRVLKAQGMSEAALGVHVENPNGAFRLYETMGYRVFEMSKSYRKPLT